jgi:hypothetical protein
MASRSPTPDPTRAASRPAIRRPRIPSPSVHRPSVHRPSRPVRPRIGRTADDHRSPTARRWCRARREGTRRTPSSPQRTASRPRASARDRPAGRHRPGRTRQVRVTRPLAPGRMMSPAANPVRASRQLPPPDQALGVGPGLLAAALRAHHPQMGSLGTTRSRDPTIQSALRGLRGPGGVTRSGPRVRRPPAAPAGEPCHRARGHREPGTRSRTLRRACGRG